MPDARLKRTTITWDGTQRARAEIEATLHSGMSLRGTTRRLCVDWPGHQTKFIDIGDRVHQMQEATSG